MLEEEMVVAIQTCYEGGTQNFFIGINRDGKFIKSQGITSDSKFRLVKKGNSKWAFYGSNGKFISADNRNPMDCLADEPLRAQAFKLVMRNGSLDNVNLFSKFHGYYVCCDPKCVLQCNREKAYSYETFKIFICNG